MIPPTTAPKVGARHFAVRTDGPDRPTKHKRRRNGMGFQRPSDRRPAGRGEGPSHPGVGVAATGAPVHLAGAPGDSMDEAPGRELFLGEKGMRAADTSSAVPRVVTPAFTADSLVLSAYGMGDGTGWGPGRCGSPSPPPGPHLSSGRGPASGVATGFEPAEPAARGPSPFAVRKRAG